MTKCAHSDAPEAYCHYGRKCLCAEPKYPNRFAMTEDGITRLELADLRGQAARVLPLMDAYIEYYTQSTNKPPNQLTLSYRQRQNLLSGLSGWYRRVGEDPAGRPHLSHCKYRGIPLA